LKDINQIKERLWQRDLTFKKNRAEFIENLKDILLKFPEDADLKLISKAVSRQKQTCAEEELLIYQEQVNAILALANIRKRVREYPEVVSLARFVNDAVFQKKKFMDLKYRTIQQNLPLLKRQLHLEIPLGMLEKISAVKYGNSGDPQQKLNEIMIRNKIGEINKIIADKRKHGNTITELSDDDFQMIQSQVINVQRQLDLEEDLKLVVTAMSNEGNASHWFKCPNGHYYFIGECGGAMQQSTCIDCGAQVGGTQHRIVGSNTHAGINGSKALWPT